MLGAARSWNNRILNGNPSNNYPWEALIFNRLGHTGDFCPITYNLFGENPDEVQFDLCSGSLITNKHVLTSADCLLLNRNEIEAGQGKKKPKFSIAECIFVMVGESNKRTALKDKKLVKVTNRIVHPHAFTDVSEYNYNIGKTGNN